MVSRSSMSCQFLSTLSLRRATTSQVPTWFGIPNFYPRSPCGERPPTQQPPRQQPRHFYPRSPCGERQMHALKLTDAVLFLSTLSLRRATSNESSEHTNDSNFYPRSPCGERQRLNNPVKIKVIFLSTLSLRRATASWAHHTGGPRISIHALLAESDGGDLVHISALDGISIHALLAESDQLPALKPPRVFRFLSTLSLRRATIISPHSTPDSGNFYPRSPCGERPSKLAKTSRTEKISIHALLAESDSTIMLYNPSSLIFLSTLSLRRATQ